MILFSLAVCAGPVQAANPPAPFHHGQAAGNADSKSGQGRNRESGEKGAAAGNGSSSTGKTEAILVAEVVLPLLVGRILGEGMQRRGRAVDRRAAEVSFALARATGAGVSALYVSQTDGHSRTRLREEGVLKDIVQLAERYDVRLSTHISKRSGAAEAILREAGKGCGMIVMGASARPGEQLFFGNTAAQIFQDWPGPLLLVAS